MDAAHIIFIGGLHVVGCEYARIGQLVALRVPRRRAATTRWPWLRWFFSCRDSSRRGNALRWSIWVAISGDPEVPRVVSASCRPHGRRRTDSDIDRFFSSAACGGRAPDPVGIGIAAKPTDKYCRAAGRWRRDHLPGLFVTLKGVEYDMVGALAWLPTDAWSNIRGRSACVVAAVARPVERHVPAPVAGTYRRGAERDLPPLVGNLLLGVHEVMPVTRSV